MTRSNALWLITITIEEAEKIKLTKENEILKKNSIHLKEIGRLFKKID
jgi:hypothetical protein